MGRNFVARSKLRIAWHVLPALLVAQQAVAAPPVEKVKSLAQVKKEADACLQRADKSQEISVKTAARTRCDLQRIRGMQDGAGGFGARSARNATRSAQRLRDGPRAN